MKIETVAVIMARGGSRGIPDKNSKLLNGIPLLAYTLDAAYSCDLIDLVVFTSEDLELKSLFLKYAAIYDPDKKRTFLVDRPDYLAQDHVQVGEVVTHAVRQLEMADIHANNLIVLQPTSPFRTYTHIYEAFEEWERVGKKQTTLLGARNAGGYYWEHDFVDNTPAIPLGHNPSFRQGRQWDYQDHSIMRENGALYIMPFENVSLWGNVRKPPFQVYPMSQEDSVDLDTLDDWAKAAELMKSWKSAPVMKWENGSGNHS